MPINRGMRSKPEKDIVMYLLSPVEQKRDFVHSWFWPWLQLRFFRWGERISGRGPVKSCVKSRLLSITSWHDAELFKLGRRKRNYCTGRPPRQQSLILDRSVRNSKRSVPCIKNLKRAKHMVVQRWRGSTKKTCKFRTSLFLIASADEARCIDRRCVARCVACDAQRGFPNRGSPDMSPIVAYGPQKWLFLVFCSIFEGIVIHAVQWKNRDRADCDRFEFSIFCGDAGMYLF